MRKSRTITYAVIAAPITTFWINPLRLYFYSAFQPHSAKILYNDEALLCLPQADAATLQQEDQGAKMI
ncbi:MAG: hypothetical protein ICV53_01165 [Flavisolibacter sp.]|nr:hypothetical protein [Flavisolibacter sp.]